MKIFTTLLIVILLSCQNASNEKSVKNSNTFNLEKKTNEIEKIDENEKRFRDSLYYRESDHFISKLEEIPNRDSNAYKLTIFSKNGVKQFTKILNTRPQMSMINYCNDFYTVVGFPCGGPCYSQVFVFTDENRPLEQYNFGQSITGNPTIIAHIKNEEFETLLVRNLKNGKEIPIDISDAAPFNFGQMDTLYLSEQNLEIQYLTKNHKTRKRTISLKKIRS